MSGGSWDYLTFKMQDAADALKRSDCPQRRTFGFLMDKCAKAMHDIEWVDSGDKSAGAEFETIQDALAGVDMKEVIATFRADLQMMIDGLDAMHNSATGAKEE